jgi:hypothetical protein
MMFFWVRVWKVLLLVVLLYLLLVGLVVTCYFVFKFFEPPMIIKTINLSMQNISVNGGYGV